MVVGKNIHIAQLVQEHEEIMNTSENVFYYVYEYDKDHNKRLICGAKSKQMIEELLEKHGYENKTITWGKQLVFASQFQPIICEGIIQ